MKKYIDKIILKIKVYIVKLKNKWNKK